LAAGLQLNARALAGHEQTMGRFADWKRRLGFRRAYRRTREGQTADEVLAILGPPDLVGEGDGVSGISETWEYHDRVEVERDTVIAFRDGVVAYCSTRHVPDPEMRASFRSLGRAYKR
jgi:hypothetical protein